MARSVGANLGALGEGANRRDFMRLALFGSLGIAALSSVGVFLAVISPQKEGTFGGPIAAGTIDDIKSDEVKRFPQGKFWLSRYKEPALNNKDVLLALYWKCAHLGCTVPWRGEENVGIYNGVFHCPCHGSTYTRTGQNIAGPATRPLDIMAIRLQGRAIIVETGQITQRVKHDPQLAIPIL